MKDVVQTCVGAATDGANGVPRTQVAALCTRGEGPDRQILMIRSLHTQRWIIPKGWPMEGRSLAAAALQEAWEEAGVEGQVNEAAIGSYTYRKIRKNGLSVACVAQIFHVEVSGLSTSFPDFERRKPEWMRPVDAASLVAESDLAALIASL